MEDIVELPGGLVHDDGQRLDVAVLRPLAGREEDWLVQHPGTPSAVATTWLLGACLIQLGDAPVGPDLAQRLLVGDRDFLMLQLRRLTLGDSIGAVLSCPKCGARMDVDIRANEIPVERCRQTAVSYAVPLGDEDGITRSARVRLVTGADQEAVLSMEPRVAAERLLDRCLIEAPGPLTAPERQVIGEAMGRLAPQVNLELDLTCPDCAASFVTPFDTTAYFLDEMRQEGRSLLREVHTLAFFYHWSEAEILGLTRDRRRAYLSLLSDALRRD